MKLIDLKDIIKSEDSYIEWCELWKVGKDEYGDNINKTIATASIEFLLKNFPCVEVLRIESGYGSSGEPILFIQTTSDIMTAAEKQEMRSRKFQHKKYVMIVTSENDRYGDDEYDLSFYADSPHEGLLEDIVYGNTFKELFGDASNEGLFYQLYSTLTGERIGSGVLDPCSPQDEIDEFERNLKNGMESKS